MRRLPISDVERILAELARLSAALERLTPPAAISPDFAAADAFVWVPQPDKFEPVSKVNRVPFALLEGIENVSRQLLDNTERFARGLPANNALLWGARGMGKSSLVKAVHAEVTSRRGTPRAELQACLKLVEIHREDIATLPRALSVMCKSPHRFIVFCDDLSFDHDDTSYKSLKAVLDGGIEGRPDNVIFYATSNRRHLMPRDMVDNERATAINPGEAVEEKVSLSDRFGLWLGFHSCTQDQYLTMVHGYADYHHLAIEREALDRDALEWAITRGGRSGRVAMQYIQDLAGRLGQNLIDEAGHIAKQS